MSINGGRDKEPTRIGIAAVDMGTGLYTCVSILMALLERQRSGKGQYIDMTLFDCAVSLMHPHVPNYYLSGGKIPQITGNQHSNLAPMTSFPPRPSTCSSPPATIRPFAACAPSWAGPSWPMTRASWKTPTGWRISASCATSWAH